MKIWIDADACPRAVREITIKACTKRRILVILVADRHLNLRPSKMVSLIRVPTGEDAVDDRIVEEVKEKDIVITADLPLASRVVDLGCTALNPRGFVYTEANVRERVSMRDFAQELRDVGLDTGGPKPFSERDRKKFADALDRTITRQLA